MAKIKRCPDCTEGKCNSCKGTGERKIINSRSKGSTFERKISKDISAWSGMQVVRTPMSGGWSKTGDITPKNPADMVNFHLCLELKKREAWSLTDLLTGKNKTYIEDWWQQCIGDASKSSRTPILIFTRNNHPELVMAYYKDFKSYSISYLLHSSGRVIFLYSDLIKLPFEEVNNNCKF